MALHIAPPRANPTTTHLPSSAPSAPGINDTLRTNLSLIAPPSPTTHPDSFHPLESRLARWSTTQHNLKMTLLRRQFGIAEPVKRCMELKIVEAGEWRPAVLGMGGNVHADILMGKEAEFGWEDVFVEGEMRERVDFHVEMEGRSGMGWW